MLIIADYRLIWIVWTSCWTVTLVGSIWSTYVARIFRSKPTIRWPLFCDIYTRITRLKHFKCPITRLKGCILFLSKVYLAFPVPEPLWDKIDGRWGVWSKFENDKSAKDWKSTWGWTFWRLCIHRCNARVYWLDETKQNCVRIFRLVPWYFFPGWNGLGNTCPATWRPWF